MPGLPFLQRDGGLCNTDVIDAKIASEQSDWTKEATTYVRDRITPDSRYKLKKFIDDEKLNRIRLDATLFHILKSDGSYVHARTGRRTKIGDNARQKSVGRSEEDEADKGMVAKVRRCPPRCIVCCATNDPKKEMPELQRQQYIVQFVWCIYVQGDQTTGGLVALSISIRSRTYQT